MMDGHSTIDPLFVALALLVIVALCAVLQSMRNSFYRAYFFQKQRNAGKDPIESLKSEFPWIWRLM